MEQYFIYLAIFILISISFGILHLYSMAVCGVLLFRLKPKSEYKFDRKFVVLIPAHNEEHIIHNVLNSLKANDYPERYYKIILIADNCTDKTAVIANSLDVIVWERNDENKKGKGHALKWAIEKLNLDEYDIIAVIDADNYVDKDFLKTTAGLINKDHQVIQTFSGFTHADKTPYAYLQYLSNLVENYLYYSPRTYFGLYGSLKGSGMVFDTDVFKKIQWESQSIVEDFDQSVRFLEKGIPVSNFMHTRVYEKTSRYFTQAFKQRIRGSSGVFQVINNHFIKLIMLGVRNKQWRLIEFAFSLLLLSRPLLIYFSILAMMLGFFGTNPFFTFIWGFINSILLVIYLFFGLLLSPSKGPKFRAILLSPFFGLYLLIIQFLSLFGYQKNKWVRTKRIIDE